jgi:hypothetical protein
VKEYAEWTLKGRILVSEYCLLGARFNLSPLSVFCNDQRQFEGDDLARDW